jgi:site-specific recombinase
MIQDILLLHTDSGHDPAAMLAELVDAVRPENPARSEQAANLVLSLCRVLDTQPQARAVLRQGLFSLLAGRKPVSLYVDSGIQPNTGFFSELWRRIGRKILPDAVNPLYLKDLLARIFPRVTDEQWVLAVPDETWLELLEAMRFDEEQAREGWSPVFGGIADAILVLSYRISATGLEPELVRGHPELEDYASPFIAQNIETAKYLAQFAEGESVPEQDERQVLVMLDQCRQVIARIKRTTSQNGTSIRLTFLLQRLLQQIDRQQALLAILGALRTDPGGRSVYPLVISLYKVLVAAECHKNDLGQHWRENMELLSLRVTENASRTGEHYITETRREYLGLMRSAMGAGCIIAVMAMLKIVAAGRHMAPLTEAIVFSLNYGLGFVLIHLLHFTVATKQPAMTAAAIAASIGESGGRTREMEGLITLIARTMRSQIVAIIGNVMLAVPVSMLIAWSIFQISGSHFVSPEKALHLLQDTDPVHSGALFYAAVAGVCLFLSGLIAGYHDNLAIYNQIPERLRGLAWLARLIGQRRLDHVAHYVENNLGALAGNFYFGLLLGGMTGLGVLLGIPLDIRHIAFSSAYFGFSMVGLEFQAPAHAALLAALGVALIGLTNLLVSFGLALYVAMKSRRVTFVQWQALRARLWQRFYRQPREFLLPPAREIGADSAQ